ncbi:MAG TPA: hypothetical protein VFA11_10145 [Acidimicrobiales bacterium]|nr:hypothetical protein [Acidimicrobiales bacterium]
MSAAVLPVEPLERAVARLVADAGDRIVLHPQGPLRRRPGINGILGSKLARSFWRARRAGRLSPELADRICIEVLRLHPAEVYGDQWWAACRPARRRRG